MKHRYKMKDMRLILTLVIGACWLPAMPAEEPVVDAALPEPLCLNGEWSFKLLPDADAAATYRNFYEEDFDRSGFDKIRVPSNWALEGFEDPRYINGSEAEGFYTRTFMVPENAKDLRAILHFGGVWVSAEVWLNGENLGRHDSGFTAFAYDISSELKAGEPNRISVRVRQQIPASLFKFDANDDWGLAGIFRDVWIEFTPKHLYLERVEVSTDLDDACESADLAIRAFVARNERDHYLAPSAPFDIRAILTSPDGEHQQVLTKEITVAGAHNGRDTHLVMRVADPHTWTAETPALYHLRVEIVRNGVVVHKWEDRIGLREVSTAGGVLRVNGQPVKLRGVASHDLYPDTGRATTREQWLKDIRLMKDANINAIRMAHYPHAEGFIRLCDEMGLYVLDEIPLGFGGDRMADPIYASGMLLRIHETISRDRNRPSVIVWDFGNEDGLTYLHTVGLRAIKGLDPSRPVLLPFRAEPELPPEVDILAPHYWSAADYDSLAAGATRPVISTEYTHALGDDGLGELGARWRALTSHASGAGAMIWLWADQGILRSTKGRTVFDPMEDKGSYTRDGGELVRHSDAGPDAIYDAHGNYGTDGVVNPDRSLTRDYSEVKAVYLPVEVLTESLEILPAQKIASIPIYNGFDFTNLEETEIRWKLFRDALPVAHGTVNLEAAPHETVNLDLPLDAVDSAGDYYVHVAFFRKNGSLMGSRSVQLDTPEIVTAPGRADMPVRGKSGKQSVTVTVGDIQYVISKLSGEIESITKGDVFCAGNAGLVVWRPSTFNERNRYDRRENQHDWNTFMQDLEPTVLEWDQSSVEGGVIVHAKTLYSADDLNQVTVDYTYFVKSDGSLEVSTTVLPEMDIPELPEIGVILDLKESVTSLVWRGEGPGDSLPGKSEATLYGWWSTGLDSAMAYGTKSGLYWAQVNFAGGPRLRILGPDGIRLENPDKGLRLRVLTHLGGVWTKNGPPEYKQWHLNLEPGKVFSGTFILEFQDEATSSK